MPRVSGSLSSDLSRLFFNQQGKSILWLSLEGKRKKKKRKKRSWKALASNLLRNRAGQLLCEKTVEGWDGLTIRVRSPYEVFFVHIIKGLWLFLTQEEGFLKSLLEYVGTEANAERSQVLRHQSSEVCLSRNGFCQDTEPASFENKFHR